MSLQGRNFILKFKDSRLGRAKMVFDADMPEVVSENADPEGYIYVNCDKCDVFMNYDETTGKWICPECGAKTKASSVYAKFGRECIDFMNNHPDFNC